MKFFLLIMMFISQVVFSQSVSANLGQSVKELMSSSSAISAQISVYIADDQGGLIYEFNGDKGLSCGSTQKIFTAAAALETLGKDYQYKTNASYSGKINNGLLEGDFFLSSNGDPTLGSWRYEVSKPENFKPKLLEAIKKSGIKSISGNLVVDDSYFDFQSIPGGWPWNDLGNYYGAGTYGVNWRENQFDVNVNGNQIENYSYELDHVQWINELKTGGNSDQSYIFTAPHSGTALINGTLPAGKVTTVSGATPNPPMQLALEIKKFLEDNGVSISGKVTTYYNEKVLGRSISKAPHENQVFEYKSPSLDKIIYWLMRKSVNMYGETLIKTMSKEKKSDANYNSAVSFLKDFWKSKGLNPYMINFADGSGLSPQNYVSSKAEVQALLYSKKQSWFNVYYESFPTQNGMKIKSGTIKNNKSFAGYHTSKNGKNYVFSIILNNYQGGDISKALYKILDQLK